jgi:hypothetical protein
MSGVHDERGGGVAANGGLLHGIFTSTPNAFSSLTLSEKDSSTTSAAEHHRRILDSIFASPMFHLSAAFSEC